MQDTTPLLEMKGVTKEFYGNQVLKDINFSLNTGEILGLVGENGAGKTTLMRILFGMTVIHETGGYGGDVLINGSKVSYNSPLEALNDGIGMAHQEFSLIPGFSAAENILLNRESTKYNVVTEVFGDRMRTLDRKDMKERAVAAIEKLGIKLDENMLINQMPVGHKQFTEIARELEKKNLKLLVLDEPTAVLGESEAEILLDSMRKLAQAGISIIFISHRLQEVLDVCDKVLVLRDGMIAENTKASETSIPQMAQAMVGREVKNQTARREERELDEVLLEVKRLWVNMPGETVRDESFDVKKGEIFGIGGLAGQGKLGIPNGIMGLYPSGGEVLLRGKEIPRNAPRDALDAKLAFVAEDRRGVGLLLDESLEWNVAFTAMQVNNAFLRVLPGGFIRWRDDAKIREVTEKYIDSLQVKCTSVKQKARELSGGNQQKICLARAFALEPDILFVSEPTRGIDVGAKKIVLDTLKQYNRELGTTIVMISSELEELRSICDRIAIIDEGEVCGTLPASSPSADFGLLMVGKTKDNRKSNE